MNVIPRRPNRQSTNGNSASANKESISSGSPTASNSHSSSSTALPAVASNSSSSTSTFQVNQSPSSTASRASVALFNNRLPIKPDSVHQNGSPIKVTSSPSIARRAATHSTSTIANGQVSNNKTLIEFEQNNLSPITTSFSRNDRKTLNYRSSCSSSTRLSTSDLPTSPTNPISSSSSPTADRSSSTPSATLNPSNAKRRSSAANRREPKLSPEIIFLIREHAKTLESISLITRKLHEIEVKVDQMSSKSLSGDCHVVDADRLLRNQNQNNGQHSLCNATNSNLRPCSHATFDTCNSSKRASTSSTSAGHVPMPNVLSDDSGGEYGRNTNTTNTNSGDEDELLSLLDKITKCSTHIQQTQAAAAAQTNAVLHSIDARLPSTASSTAMYMASQYASPMACASAVSINQQPIPLSNTMFAPTLAAQHTLLNSNDLYQTARQTPHLAYANQSIAGIPMAQHHPPIAFSAPPFQTTAALPSHMQHLVHHPHSTLQPTFLAAPAYLQTTVNPLAALQLQQQYASTHQPITIAQHPLQAHHHLPSSTLTVTPNAGTHLPTHSPSAPPLSNLNLNAPLPANQSSSSMNAMLFEPNVERFLHNLDQLVNANDCHAPITNNINNINNNNNNNNSASSPMMMANAASYTNSGRLSAILSQSNAMTGSINAITTTTATTTINSNSNSNNVALQHLANRTFDGPSNQTNACSTSIANTKHVSNWQLEKAVELLAKKERQNIDARYKLADEWLANCLARDSSSSSASAVNLNRKAASSNQEHSPQLMLISQNNNNNQHSAYHYQQQQHHHHQQQQQQSSPQQHMQQSRYLTAIVNNSSVTKSSPLSSSPSSNPTHAVSMATANNCPGTSVRSSTVSSTASVAVSNNSNQNTSSVSTHALSSTTRTGNAFTASYRM